MAGGCGKEVEYWFRSGWTMKSTTVECGSTWGGDTILCDDCEKAQHERYPQGWRYYPGDTCKHGVYVGGIGVDWMCPQCEMGDDDEDDQRVDEAVSETSDLDGYDVCDRSAVGVIVPDSDEPDLGDEVDHPWSGNVVDEQGEIVAVWQEGVRLL